MDIVAPFVADGEPPEPMEPGERTFDHPAEDPEPAAMRTAGLGDARDNALRREAGVTRLRPVGAIALVGLRLGRPRRPATASEFREQPLMQAPPDARLLPADQSAPGGATRPAPHLLLEHLPGPPGAQDIQDTGEHRPVRDRRSAVPMPAAGPVRGNQRRDDLPQLVVEEGSGHARPYQGTQPS